MGSVGGQVIHNLLIQNIFIFIIEGTLSGNSVILVILSSLFFFIEGQVYVVVCQIQGIHNVILVGAVEDRCGYVEAQRLGSKAQVNLQHLSDIHTGRHTQRIQDNVQRTSVGKEGHILHGKHTGNDTLVSMTACHLVSYGDLSLLGNVNADCLVHTRSQLVAVFPGEYTGVHHDTVLAVGNLQGGVSHLTGLLTEDCPQKPFLRGQLRLSLRCYLSYQDIPGTNLRADADDTSVVQILQGVVTYAGNIPCDLLRPQLRIPGLRLIFFNMNGCVHIVHNKSLTQKNRVLVIVTLPGHESDQWILSKGDLSVGGGRTVRDYLACRYSLALVHDGPLVVAVALVTSHELRQMVRIPGTVIVFDDDFLGCGTLHRTVFLGNNAHARVHSRLYFHTCSHHGSFRRQKRHRLTLHVGSHQRAVRVVVLQEGDQGCSHGEHHLRRNVHVVEHPSLVLLCLLPVTAGNILSHEMAFFVQSLIRLRHMVIILFVRRHVDNLIRYPRILGICLINLTVGRFHEAVLIDSGIRSQGVDQSDVRSLRRLDGAHSSVMGVMYVSYLESGPVTGQTAGAQGGQTSLVGQLTQRIVLIHKLGQLGGSEELLHRRRHRLDVDQRLGGNSLQILGGHPLPYHTLQPGQADAVLVLKKLAHGTDTPVAQMVDIIIISDAVLQVNIIVNRSQYILFCNMLRDQVMDIPLHSRLDILDIVIFFQYFFKYRVVY